MNAVVPVNFGPVSNRFVGQKVENDLAAGVSTGFGVISFRGKVWRIKYRGEERDLMRPDGDGPAHSIEVVIVRSSTIVSKIFYKEGYKEGSTESPDCFSTNGQTPDASSKNKQANTCAGCPMNAWGSRITPAGKPGKACSDSKRVVVVPLNDIANEVFGGPMLLRVPAASLQDAASYATTIGQLGYPIEAVGTRIAFDTKEAYPKLLFSAIRPLTDAEADKVLALREDPRVARILAEGSEHAAPVALPAPTPQSVFEQPPHDPETGEIKAEPQKREYKKKAAAPAPAPVIPPVEENAATGTSFDDELDAQLDGLLPK